MTRDDFLAFALASMAELQNEISLEDRVRLRWLHDFQVDVLREEKLAHAVWVSDRVQARQDVQPLVDAVTTPQTHGFALYNRQPQFYRNRWRRIGGYSETSLASNLLIDVQSVYNTAQDRSTVFRLRGYAQDYQSGQVHYRDAVFRLIGFQRIDKAKAGITEDRYRIVDKPNARVGLTANLWHWKAALGIEVNDEDSGQRWSKLLRKLERHDVYLNSYAMGHRGNYLVAQRERAWMTWECGTTYEEAADKLVLLVETLRKENERPTP